MSAAIRGASVPEAPPRRNIEDLQRAIGRLVVERQAFHARNAGRDELESNRLELVDLQQQLAHALIDRYLRCAERDAA